MVHNVRRKYIGKKFGFSVHCSPSCLPRGPTKFKPIHVLQHVPNLIHYCVMKSINITTVCSTWYIYVYLLCECNIWSGTCEVCHAQERIMCNGKIACYIGSDIHSENVPFYRVWIQMHIYFLFLWVEHRTGSHEYRHFHYENVKQLQFKVYKEQAQMGLF